MVIVYDPTAAILKYSFKLEDVPIDQQYANLVSSIKKILSDSTVPELDKQSLISLLKTKTGSPIDTKDDLLALLDNFLKIGENLEEAYQQVDSETVNDLPSYSTSEDVDAITSSVEPLAEPFDTSGDEL